MKIPRSSDEERMQEQLNWKSAFLEAQVNSSIDGILVVDEHGKKILQNQRVTDLLKIPRQIAEDKDDEKQVRWVTGMMKTPEQFIEKVVYLYSHPDEISRDEIELKDGTILDRYSSPVVGKDGKYYGRIWTFRDMTERRRVEQELKAAKIAAVLREGAERYNFLADTVPLIIWTARPDGGLDYYNKAWFDYTGLTLAQTENWGWGTVLHPDDLQPCIERWTHSFTAGEDYQIEYRFKRGADGVYRWFLGRASARRNEKGEIVQWVGTCTDIDDQKRAQAGLELRVLQRTAELASTNETLRESNEKFHQLADNITDVFWIRSPDMSEVHYVSPAYERIWGRPVESLYANPHQWADFIFPADRERVLDTFAALTGDTRNLDIEYRIVRPDGEIRWIHARGFQVRDAADKLIRHTGIVTDITERKKADDALRESEERFSGAFEHAPIGVALVSPDGHWLKVNRAFCDMIGYSDAELAVRTFQDITHPEDLAADLANARRLLAGEIRSYQMEKRYVHARGDFVTVLLNVSLVRDGRGQPRYFISQIQDITERKRLEAQLFQSQKLETVGKLAGGIAHEFNSILTAIIGQSELLLEDLPAGSPLTSNATEISKAASRAATLTRQLLAYGRGQFLLPEALNLNQVIAGMAGVLRQLMGGEAVDVNIVPAAGLQKVKADAGQIEQIIMNLAMNAHDAMPDGGKLTLETANVSFDQDSVGRYPELKPGNYVMLAISDTGTGMSEAVKARAFEPFYTTKDVGQGTGLGLSTCYGIAKQSGGHISVYSEPGRGTTFKIYLPQIELPAKISLPRLDAPDLPRGTETILLVEDDPALREMAATLLRRLGYTVWAAANGIEALSLKQQRDVGHVDLLFTDVVMPHMSGRELADRVRALYPHTRILFASAYTENAIVHQGVLDKGAALLQKPFTPSLLARKVREVLDPAR